MRRAPAVFERHNLSDLSTVIDVANLTERQNVLDQNLVESRQQCHGLTGGQVEIHTAVVAVNGKRSLQIDPSSVFRQTPDVGSLPQYPAQGYFMRIPEVQ